MLHTSHRKLPWGLGEVKGARSGPAGPWLVLCNPCCNWLLLKWGSDRFSWEGNSDCSLHFGNWGNVSMDKKVLAAQAWGPEFRLPAPHRNIVQQHTICYPSFMGKDKQIPRAHWPDSLAESVSLSFSERPHLNKVWWRCWSGGTEVKEHLLLLKRMCGTYRCGQNTQMSKWITKIGWRAIEEASHINR